MGPEVLHPCLLLLWVWVCALPAGSVLPPELSKAEVTRMFRDFMIQFNRTYRSPAEQHRRFGIFTQSLLAARRLQETELGTGQYGVTRFSDWTDEEFRGMFRSSLPPTMHQAPRLPRKKLPPFCDWRKAGAVTAVKYQGEKCRSCWAFAAVANIESLWNIHFHQPRNLSVQEVLDCSWCGAGCEGGYVWDAFTTVLQRRGLTSEDAYPYTGRKGTCRNLNEPAAYIQGFQTLRGDETEIAAHVATKGPITVTLNSAAMKHYKKGISQPLVKSCSPEHVDHVVLLVGYGHGLLPSLSRQERLRHHHVPCNSHCHPGWGPRTRSPLPHLKGVLLLQRACGLPAKTPATTKTEITGASGLPCVMGE
ncbi:cathepsin W-like isoform X2 [Mauremys reevesii]|uniref:cathepsin W-like isoform X2 n=1 Tax=Mauremys reevesii TaxID=260615 RepID=UPI00193FBBF2|nr:cathepsin W-like isoform X2 [Mauremys reevesii]